MEVRCAIVGREWGRAPDPMAFDEGAVSLQYLFSQGAQKQLVSATAVDLDEPSLRGNTGLELASGTTRTTPADVVNTGVHLTEQAFEEEDPFGHGFDLDEAAGLAPSPAVAAPVLQEEALVERTGESSGAHPTHKPSRVAHVVWCVTCGRHAAVRL